MEHMHISFLSVVAAIIPAIRIKWCSDQAGKSSILELLHPSSNRSLIERLTTSLGQQRRCIFLHEKAMNSTITLICRYLLKHMETPFTIDRTEIYDFGIHIMLTLHLGMCENEAVMILVIDDKEFNIPTTS
jgi:hypothetical protein